MDQLDIKTWATIYKQDLKQVYREFFATNVRIAVNYEDFVTYCYEHSHQTPPRYDLDPHPTPELTINGGFKIVINARPPRAHKKVSELFDRVYDDIYDDHDKYFDLITDFYDDLQAYLKSEMLLILGHNRSEDFFTFCLDYINRDFVDWEHKTRYQSQLLEQIRDTGDDLPVSREPLDFSDDTDGELELELELEPELVAVAT